VSGGDVARATGQVLAAVHRSAGAVPPARLVAPPLAFVQQLWAVVLSAPAPSAICAWTALRVWGMQRVDDDGRVHLLVPKGCQVLPTPGVARQVHESRRFGTSDVWPVPRPTWMTGLTRSAIDAAAWTRDARGAARVVVNAVQQRLCTASDLLEQLERVGRVQHVAMLRKVLQDVAGGAHALSELDFLAFCRRHGFPRLRLQVRSDAGGRRRYLDAEFRRADGRVVRVEIDGGVHLTLTQRWLDTRHDNEAILDGQVVLRFPSVAVHLDDALAVSQLSRALGLVRR
jgi:hypothetical protein